MIRVTWCGFEKLVHFPILKWAFGASFGTVILKSSNQPTIRRGTSSMHYLRNLPPKLYLNPLRTSPSQEKCCTRIMVSVFFLLLFNFISQVYPGRDITNIVESSHYQKIGGWCRQGALNAAKCKGAQRWIKPFRCLGKCQSENEKQNATVNDSTVNERYFCDDFPFLKVFDFGNW